MPCCGGVRELLVAPGGLGALTPRISRKAACPWHDARGWRVPDPLASSGAPQGSPVTARPHERALLKLPGRCSPSGLPPAQGQKSLTKGTQITLTRGQDHCEAVVGLLHLEAVARARFPCDSPIGATGAERGYPAHSTPASSTLLHLHPFSHTHPCTRSQATRLTSGPGRATGW